MQSDTIDPHDISNADLRRLAVEADCDPRSIAAELGGRRVRGIAGVRARRVLRAHGLPCSDDRRAAA